MSSGSTEVVLGAVMLGCAGESTGGIAMAYSASRIRWCDMNRASQARMQAEFRGDRLSVDTIDPKMVVWAGSRANQMNG